MRIFAVDNLGYINMLKMPMVHWAMRWGVLVFWAAAVSAQCPKENLMSAELCDGHIDQCIDNTDCTGQSICCSTGCAKVCILPASVKEPHTVQIGACRQMRSAVEKRSRSLGQYIPLPACTPSGDFAPIQCNDVAGNCFCVDHKTGFELAGTRQRSLDLVNCNEPNPCANFLCRMLCPYDFELDADGCPICECRDPCKDVTCPGNLECRLEELPCSDDICPPIPMCRQARTLDNFCPTGSPLKQVGERPFLCGPTESGPHCPPLFECIVHDGAEYGACCPATAEITKPGKCIIPTPLPKQCGSHCEEDIHCPGLAKCCSDDFCGKHCTEPQNVTVCLQQKLLAEILSINEFEGKGYVPECDEQGNFETRQCSRNGLVCWCVDQDGIKIPRSIGAADKVFCDNEVSRQSRQLTCDNQICAHICQYGFQLDRDGCQTCECQNPCEGYKCPVASQCVVVYESACTDGPLCPAYPKCQPLSQIINPCTVDEPLFDSDTNEVQTCYPGVSECPTSHECTLIPETRDGVCCPSTTDLKPGICPVRDDSECENLAVCTADIDCSGELKCCQVGECGLQCVLPANTDSVFNSFEHFDSLPTMCEYLRDFSNMVANGYTKVLGLPVDIQPEIAVPLPLCKSDGSYSDRQCDLVNKLCWCVDEFGTEMPRSRHTTEQDLNCTAVKDSTECLTLNCRLGCDYGFVLEDSTGCPVCECRNPCEHVTCREGSDCEMLDVQCGDALCPPIPQCITTTNPLQRVDELQNDEPVDVENEAHIGQCPYLIPLQFHNCVPHCSTDEDCNNEFKCCSNGCGSECVKPFLMTACQHSRYVLEHQARETGMRGNQLYLPACNETTGDYEPLQCHPASRVCWCVDEYGLEVAGTRTLPGITVDCSAPVPRQCVPIQCKIDCTHGYRLDDDGCATCHCHEPCDSIHCSPGFKCSVEEVYCTSEPCLPIPMCQPSRDNPCEFGEPLMHNDTGEMMNCGGAKSCPSSHLCLTSPFGSYASCCPKSRDACLIELDTGLRTPQPPCNGLYPRWYFNRKSNKCEEFLYSGCGGTANMFDSLEHCITVCPALSECQRLADHNTRIAASYQKSMFVPRCNPVTGDFQPVQCLDELGLCWCVNMKGQMVKGSLIRGTPTCNERRSRLLHIDTEIQPVCDGDEVVHLCDPTLCRNKVCLSNPTAYCVVNPCGGCSFQFIDSTNNPVDCNNGLSACELDAQMINNSPGFTSKIFDNFHHEGRSNELSSSPQLKIHARPDLYSIEIKAPTNAGRLNFFDLLRSLVPSMRVAGERIKRNVQREPQRPSYEFIPDWEAGERDQIATEARGPSIIAIAAPIVKPGVCPANSLPSILRILTNNCQDDCLIDTDCPHNQKCCSGDCGLRCVDPLVVPHEMIPKKGKCPAPPSDLSLVKCTPLQDCFLDSDCEGNKKCCFNGCGATCVLPEDNTLPTVLMRPTTPMCKLSGEYPTEMKSDDLTWCVDRSGNPIHETLTRGYVQCNIQGKIIEQHSTGPVCEPGQSEPRVCQKECLNVACQSHPEAICRSDPCNSCETYFTGPLGEVVDCRPKCSQPLKTGSCRATMRRYWFNSTSKQCEEFVYSGCQKNDNNFETYEECESSCSQPVSVCESEKEVGLCYARLPRWYYNTVTHHCELFFYGGCGGNGNNFNSREQCEETCPDNVLCPFVTDPTLVRPCSRVEACANLTCMNKEKAICKVDPCTCTARLVDKRGNPTTCEIIDAELNLHEFNDEGINDETEELPVITNNNVDIELEPRTLGPIMRTRCQKIREQHERQHTPYVSVCDDSGNFKPMQCYNKQETRPAECWCVDEAGNQLVGSRSFQEGTRECQHVPVESVDVSISFPSQTIKEVHQKEIKEQLREMLDSVDAERDDILVEVNDVGNAMVKFVLSGEKKVDVAFYLEEKIKEGRLKIDVGDKEIPAELSTSSFQHRLATPIINSFVDDSFHREVVEQDTAIEAPYLAVIVIFSVLTLIVMCALVIALVMHRKKTTGSYPKAPMSSLAFSSPIYDYDSKNQPKYFEDLVDVDNMEHKGRRFSISSLEHEYESMPTHGRR